MEKELKKKLSKILFHGTLMDRADKIMSEGIDFECLNTRADFGQGFYVTDSYALAEQTAKLRYIAEVQRNGKAAPPVVMRLKVRWGKCDKSQIVVKEFWGESLEWKRFVCTNRWAQKVLRVHSNYDHNTDKRYDIVIGLVADGKMKSMNTHLENDRYMLSDSVLKRIRPFVVKYTKIVNDVIREYEAKAYQISFHNQDFINTCIVYTEYDIIKQEKEDEHYE